MGEWGVRDKMEVQFDVTNRCNATCKFCFRQKDYTYPVGDMDDEVFRWIILSTNEKRYNLSMFGEPLLDKGLVSKIKLIREKHPQSEIYFSTNGQLLTKELIDNLQNAGLSYVFVSCYELYDKHNELQGTNFNHIVEMVDYFKIPVYIVSNPVVPMNMETIKHFWKQHGRSVSCIDAIEWGGDTVGTLSPITICGIMHGKTIFYWDGKRGTCCLDYNGVNSFTTNEELRNKNFKFCTGCKYKEEFDKWRKKQ